jgi:hypothetical protein
LIAFRQPSITAELSAAKLDIEIERLKFWVATFRTHGKHLVFTLPHGASVGPVWQKPSDESTRGCIDQSGETAGTFTRRVAHPNARS